MGGDDSVVQRKSTNIAILLRKNCSGTLRPNPKSSNEVMISCRGCTDDKEMTLRGVKVLRFWTMAPPGTHGRADMALVRHIFGVQMLPEGHRIRWDGLRKRWLRTFRGKAAAAS